MHNEHGFLKDEVKQSLLALSTYAKEHNLSNRKLAEELKISYDTLRNWEYFAEKKILKRPSKPNVERIKNFLKNRNSPELFVQSEEAKHRAEKIKYILLLLEDELKWFRNMNPQAREEYRKELNASDIGYISSLLTMLTDEDKFNRWLALTSARFQSFKRR